MKYTTDLEIAQVNTRDIFTDPLYQRPLDMNRVGRIIRAFDTNLVNPCKLSFRDGKFFVFDGQHTIAVLKTLNGGRDLKVACRIYRGLTQLDEATLFVEQNGLSAAVQSSAKFRALYNMGDPEITAMVKACNSLGVEVEFNGSAGSNKIVAVSSLFSMYKKLSSIDFINVLAILQGAWGGRPGSFSRELLTGMTLFYETYRGRFKDSRLIDSLNKYTSPAAIVHDGKTARAPGAGKYARQILGAYNFNASKNRLPDEL